MTWRVSSCCCFSLRTGTLILGYFGVIGSILTAISIVSSKPYVKDWVIEATKDDPSFTSEEIEWVIKYVHVVLNIVLGISLIGILLSASLLFGVYKEKMILIKIYLIVAIISCIFLMLIAVLYLIGSFANPKMLGNFVGQLLSTALQIYFTMVIHSYRMDVIESGRIKRNGYNLSPQV